jgi:hypothetical protein
MISVVLLGGCYYLWWVFSHPWCAVVLLFGYVSRCPIVACFGVYPLVANTLLHFTIPAAVKTAIINQPQKTTFLKFRLAYVL